MGHIYIILKGLAMHLSISKLCLDNSKITVSIFTLPLFFALFPQITSNTGHFPTPANVIAIFHFDKF